MWLTEREGGEEEGKGGAGMTVVWEKKDSNAIHITKTIRGSKDNII